MTTATWTGQQSFNGRWEDGANWSTRSEPDASTGVVLGDVRVHGVPYTVYLSSAASVADAVISAQATLEIQNGGSDGGRLSASGGIDNEGIIRVDAGQFGSSVASDVQFRNGGSIMVDGVANDARLDLPTAFLNVGLVAVEQGQVSAELCRNVDEDGHLSGGRWTATHATLSIFQNGYSHSGVGITSLDDIAVTLSGADSRLISGDLFAPIDAAQTLAAIGTGATLSLLDGAGWTTQLTLEVDGTLELAGGSVSAGPLTIAKGGVFDGFGQVGGTMHVAKGGTVLTDGGQALRLTGAVVVDGLVDGPGRVDVANGATLELTASARERAPTLFVEAGGTLQVDEQLGAQIGVDLSGDGAHLLLGDAHKFKASITDFSDGDTIDLRGFHNASVTLRWKEGINGQAGVLHVSDGSHNANLRFYGDYTLESFHHASDHASGTVLSFAADSIETGAVLHL